MTVGVLVGVPPSSRSQQAATRPRLGYLSPFSAIGGKGLLDALQDGLRKQGYNVGVNVDIEARYADEHYERLPAFASELVGRKVDVLFAVTTPAAVAARDATTTVPISNAWQQLGCTPRSPYVVLSLWYSVPSASNRPKGTARARRIND